MIFEDAILRARDIVVANANDPLRLVLFGSSARDAAGAESDLDLVVVERSVEGRHAEMVRLRAALRPLGVSIDVLVISEQEAVAWGAVEASTLHVALTHGRTLFAA